MSYVYFLKVKDSVKVGYSAFPGDRARAVLGASKVKNKFLGCIRGDQKRERQIHQLMTAKFGAPINGREWFSVTEDFHPRHVVEDELIPWADASKIRKQKDGGTKSFTVPLPESIIIRIRAASEKTGIKVYGIAERAFLLWLATQDAAPKKKVPWDQTPPNPDIGKPQ